MSLCAFFLTPATNRLVIETAFTKGFYQVFDITGKTLLEGKVNVSTKFNLDISSFSSGVYFISVSDGERQVFRKAGEGIDFFCNKVK